MSERPPHDRVPSSDGEQLLSVRRLEVSFAGRGGPLRAVRGVSFELQPGEVLALVGESGSGKSVCAMSLVGLTRGASTTISGSARLCGRELIGASEQELRGVRGGQVAMVFQDPMSSLNPVMRVGEQIAEQIIAHQPAVSKRRALERAQELLERVHMPAARARLRSYPHELSGGMRQRVMIAMALSLGPRVLLADEPTTALDVTVQQQILSQLDELRRRERMGILLITHDLAVVSSIAERVAVMRAGEIVEHGTTENVLRDPQHEYTRKLLAGLAPPARRRSLSGGGPLLRIEHLQVSFAPRTFALPGAAHRARLGAVDDVSLTVCQGETLALVGESGCGKTTLLRTIARLVAPQAGRIVFAGRDVTAARGRALAPLRAALGMVFQDPQASLNPRRRVGSTLRRALHARGVRQAGAAAERLLARVGLGAGYSGRFPHQLSGGERQRVAIARALAGEPRLVLLDEPVSSLDASLRRGVIELLAELQSQSALAYVLVAHDLAVVETASDRIAVMYLGKLVELSPTPELYAKPIHPYSAALLAAMPTVEPGGGGALGHAVLAGELPDPAAPPPGCRFHTRCPYASDICRTSEPPLVEYGDGHLAACHHPLNVTAEEISKARRSASSPLSAAAPMPLIGDSGVRSSA